VVGSNTEDCATRWWDHNGWTDGSCNASLLNQRCPTHGRISSYIPALKFVFFLLKQSPRHWRQMVPKKTLAFCCCALRCIWNSNELVCSKIKKEGLRSNETLQVQKVAVVAIWRCDCIAMVVWNLIWPALKLHDNFVLPHHLKSITRQFDLQLIPRLCCTFCSFLLHCWQIICWTKNKHQRRSHFFQKIGEYYCDVASQCGWIYWSLILRDVVYNAANVCEPHFVTGKQCAWWKIVWRLSGSDTRIAALQNLKNSCCVQAALFSLRHVSKGAFLQIAFLRISVLSFWYQFNF